MKVLVVDDEPSFLFITERYLKKKDKNLEIHTTDSALKALTLLDEHIFDIIVSDYQMPKMDGLMFLEIVREEKKSDLPFIIFTGRGAEEVAIQALNLKANRYIQKSGDIETQYDLLVDAIKREVDHHQTKKLVEKSEQALREGEEVLSITLENLPFGVFLHDLEGNFILVNKKAVETTLYSKKELLQLSVGDIDSGKITKEEREEMWERLNHGELMSFQSYHRRKDGSVFPVEVNLNAVTIQGQKLILAITQDTTDRIEKEKILRENEMRFKTMNDLLPEIVIETDENYTITHGNKKFYESLGYIEDDLKNGLDIFDLVV